MVLRYCPTCREHKATEAEVVPGGSVIRCVCCRNPIGVIHDGRLSLFTPVEWWKITDLAVYWAKRLCETH